MDLRSLKSQLTETGASPGARRRFNTLVRLHGGKNVVVESETIQTMLLPEKTQALCGGSGGLFFRNETGNKFSDREYYTATFQACIEDMRTLQFGLPKEVVDRTQLNDQLLSPQGKYAQFSMSDKLHCLFDYPNNDTFARKIHTALVKEGKKNEFVFNYALVRYIACALIATLFGIADNYDFKQLYQKATKFDPKNLIELTTDQQQAFNAALDQYEKIRPETRNKLKSKVEQGKKGAYRLPSLESLKSNEDSQKRNEDSQKRNEDPLKQMLQQLLLGQVQNFKPFIARYNQIGLDKYNSKLKQLKSCNQEKQLLQFKLKDSTWLTREGQLLTVDRENKQFTIKNKDKTETTHSIMDIEYLGCVKKPKSGCVIS